MKFSLIFLILCLEIFECSFAVNLDCACGESNLKGVGRIVNGKPTRQNKYPWMAALFAGDHIKGFHFMCGGAIISDRHILTAGHCVFYLNPHVEKYWRLGMHDQEKQDGIAYHNLESELHPKFINHSIYDDYDIAVITLVERIEFSSKIRTICLPQPNAEYPGRYAIVAGWGRLDERNDAKLPKTLMETKIKVKTNQECYRETARLLKFNPKSMVCGYEANTDACQGDSGGPFFIETSPNRYEVFGVVSFGDGCGRTFPGVYTKVSEPSTLNWIRKIIKRGHGSYCPVSR